MAPQFVYLVFKMRCLCASWIPKWDFSFIRGGVSISWLHSLMPLYLHLQITLAFSDSVSHVELLAVSSYKLSTCLLQSSLTVSLSAFHSSSQRSPCQTWKFAFSPDGISWCHVQLLLKMTSDGESNTLLSTVYEVTSLHRGELSRASKK